MIRRYEWKMTREEASMPHQKIKLWNLPRQMEKKLQKVSQDSWGPGQDLIEPDNSQIQIINLFSQGKEHMFRRQTFN